VTLFCDEALAKRIERAEADLMARASATHADGFAIPLAGGMATFAAPGSPFNKVAGLGFAGVPSVPELERIEAAFAAHGAPVQVELAQLGDPAIGALLGERGYRLESYESVLGLALAGGSEPVTPAGVAVRLSGEAELQAWLEVVTDGVLHPDTAGLPMEEFPREVLEQAERDFAAAGVIRYAALRDGVLAGGGSLHIADGIAQLAGAATAPAHRRRGVQTALLSTRLADAAAAGCDIAVVTTQPGSKSQHNVQRRGFELLYARTVLVKQTRLLSASEPV
jgi:GNAT superfamily N-acetyltransferase